MSEHWSEFPVVDDLVISRLRALRDQVARPGERLLGDLIALFEKDTWTRIETIRAAIAHNDPDTRQRAAHALKGSAGNVGALRVAALAALFEAKEGSIPDVEELAAEVDAAVRALAERLR